MATTVSSLDFVRQSRRRRKTEVEDFATIILREIDYLGLHLAWFGGISSGTPRFTSELALLT
jgi:hypothetical protein